MVGDFHHGLLEAIEPETEVHHVVIELERSEMEVGGNVVAEFAVAAVAQVVEIEVVVVVAVVHEPVIPE